jgi:hypothetical protein
MRRRRRRWAVLDISEWPTDKSARRVILDDAGPDELGRRHFTLLWWHGEQPRGQCFFSTEVLLELLRREGEV